MKKFFISMVVAALLVPQVASARSTKLQSFPDVKNDDPYTDAIRYLKDNGVVEGYKLEGGIFKPGGTVSRAEFLKMLYKVKGMTNKSGSMSFPDVPTGEWFHKYVKEAYLTGIVNGYDDNTFKPHNKISRAEAVKIVSNAFFSVDDWFKSSPYDACKDYADFSYMANDEGAWYWKYFYVADSFCVIPTDVIGGILAYDESKSISRGEMAEILYRAKAVVDSSDESPVMFKYNSKIKPDPIDNGSKPSGDPDEGLNFDPMAVKVGDEVGDWTVTKVSVAIGDGSEPLKNNFSVTFEGEATLTGVYANMYGFADVYYFDVSAESVPKVPVATSAEKSKIWFGFVNHDFAKTVFGSFYNSGNATVKIKNYTVNYAEAEIWDTAELVEVVSKDNSKVSALCTSDPEPRDVIGGTEIPVDEMLYPAGLYWLGQLFTAYDCSEERVAKHMWVDGDDYTAGSTIWLDDNPASDLLEVFEDIGYECKEAIAVEGCKSWTLGGVVKWKELIKLKPFVSELDKDDCVLCG